MDPTRSAKPITYAGTNFRSTLEARWAAFFDLVGWSWVYEPFSTGSYIPDFLIQGEAPFLVEVGPCVTVDQYREKRAKPIAAYPVSQEWVGELGDQVLYDVREWWTLVVGASPVLRLPEWRVPSAGVWATESKVLHVGDVDSAFWTACGLCAGAPKLHGPLLGRLDDAPCGHGDYGCDRLLDASWLNALWRRAGNDVQWKPERLNTILGRL